MGSIEEVAPDECCCTSDEGFKNIRMILTAVIDLLAVKGVFSSEEFNMSYSNVVLHGVGDIKPRLESLKSQLLDE